MWFFFPIAISTTLSLRAAHYPPTRSALPIQFVAHRNRPPGSPPSSSTPLSPPPSTSPPRSLLRWRPHWRRRRRASSRRTSTASAFSVALLRRGSGGAASRSSPASEVRGRASPTRRRPAWLCPAGEGVIQ